MRAILSGCLFLVLTVPAYADDLPWAMPQDVGLSAAKLAKIKPAVQALVDKKEVAGAVIGVARKGKVVLLETVGQSDVDAGKPMRPDTIFRIYPITNPIPTVAAMILYEEGKLGLDEPVATYLPEFKNLRVHTGKGDE